MGVLSSIFGERPSAPQTGGFTVGAEIPKELAPFYKDILGKSQALYNESVARGYEPYTGPSLAEFTPEQQQAFTGIAGLQGQQAPIYQEAMGMTRDAAAPITTEQIEEYMNPYQQAVVDIEKREAQKQYESQVVPQLAAKAAMAQPFGGSRQAILEGMAADTQQRLLGDIQAKGSAQAYQDAVNLLQNQRDRLGSGAGQLATLGANQFKSQLGEIGALQTVGEEKQQLAQQALNEAYGQYIKEQEFPFQQLGRYQSVVTGAPIQQTQYVPPTPPGPSVGQQLLGGAATMLGTYGAFGGKMPQLFGGATPAKTGGGIADLPVIKAQSGTGKYTLSELMRRMRNPNVIQPEYDEREYGVPYQTSADLENRNPYKRILWSLNSQKNPNAIRMGSEAYGPLKALMPRDAEEIAELSDVYSAQNTANIASNIRDNFDPAAVVSMQDELGVSYIPPSNLSEGSSISAIKDMITDRMSGLKKILQDKRDAKASRQKLKFERLTSKNSPFSDRNRPPMYAKKEDVIPPTAFEQDLSKLSQIGLEYIGDLADATETVGNLGKSAWNKIIKVGENYFLDKGDTLNLQKELDPEGSGRERVKENVKKIFGINLDIAPSDKAAKERFDNLTIDKRPGFDRGILAETDRSVEDINSWEKFKDKVKEVAAPYAEEPTTKFTINKVIKPISQLWTEIAGDKKQKIKEIEKKTKNILDEPPSDEKISTDNNNINNNIVEITDNNSSIDKKINSKSNTVNNIIKGYSSVVNKAEEKGTEAPKSVLDKKQDAYINAIKEMNKSLNEKDALINKTKEESFWAFVARVGANISKGGGITESVAAELPKAMQDRQKLIQAQSDLDDKKEQGKVSLAKADLDIETADVAAEARAREARLDRQSREKIAGIKPNYLKLGTYEESKPSIEATLKSFNNQLVNNSSLKNYLIKNSTIKGLNNNNFDIVWNEFSKSDLPERIFNRAKSDKQGGSTDSLAELYRKHLDKAWKDYSGKFRDNKFYGITIPFKSKFTDTM